MPTIQSSTRITLTNVLIATDFSPASKATLPYAAALAQQFGAHIVMAHALSPEPRLSVPLDPVPLDEDPAWQDARWNLLKFARSGGLGDSPYETVLERGDFWNVVSGLIREHKIDLVVAGTRGRQGLSKLVLGSNAEKIFRRANCPVLTIGPNVTAPEGGECKPRRILFPTDGSEVSLQAWPYALSFAEENQATLVLVQLMPLIFPEHREFEEAQGREAMRSLVPADAEAWCKPEFVVRFEFPAEGILHLARERDIDLIVMGVRKASEGGLPDHLPWPVASRVVAEAPCPVLTVRG